MAHTPHYTINAHTNDETFDCESFEFNFCNIDIIRFRINRRSKFSHFKERIETKLQSGLVYKIIYKNPVVFDNYQVIYFQLKD